MSVNEFSFVTELFGIRLNVHSPPRIAYSSSRNAVNLSSARTRFPSPRCASAMQSATPMPYSRAPDGVIRVYDAAGNLIATHEHAGDFKEP